MEFGAIAAGAGALKNIYDLISDLRKSNDPAVLKAGIEEITSRLMSTQEKYLRLSEERDALMAKVKALTTEAAKRVAFEDKAKNYVRTETKGEALVYVEKELADRNAPTAYFCPHCFGNEKFTMLQPKHPYYKFCPECGTEYLFTKLADGGFSEW